MTARWRYEGRRWNSASTRQVANSCRGVRSLTRSSNRRKDANSARNVRSGRTVTRRYRASAFLSTGIRNGSTRGTSSTTRYLSPHRPITLRRSTNGSGRHRSTRQVRCHQAYSYVVQRSRVRRNVVGNNIRRYVRRGRPSVLLGDFLLRSRFAVQTSNSNGSSSTKSRRTSTNGGRLTSNRVYYGLVFFRSRFSR